jgi:hypothetical protein
MAVNGSGLSPRGWTLAILWGGVLASLAGAVAFPQYVAAHRSQFWPTARGTVTRFEAPVAYFRERRTNLCFPQVQYTYSVGGQTFTGSRIGFRMD